MFSRNSQTLPLHFIRKAQFISSLFSRKSLKKVKLTVFNKKPANSPQIKNNKGIPSSNLGLSASSLVID